ncbi:Hypothetical protein FKW44_014473 [Caligus rogercresseyi]|uniref:Uncharacterized protein n=1 Tax=Caligus rogercresseyi TaxID=217165 RepID=A0A7T8GZV7_CALRO|nr:Hypothetical protein FKW44_014473 [Caligus rogercresseyi]
MKRITGQKGSKRLIQGWGLFQSEIDEDSSISQDESSDTTSGMSVADTTTTSEASISND